MLIAKVNLPALSDLSLLNIEKRCMNLAIIQIETEPDRSRIGANSAPMGTIP